MEGMKGKLGMLSMMAAFAAMNEGDLLGMGKKPDNQLNPKDIDATPVHIPIPKGCKEYFFNKEGEFYNGVDGRPPILKTDVVFKCVAASNKSAKKKFDKFNTNH